MKNLLEKLIILPKENEWVEFKHNFHDENEIGERISAIANSACLDNKSFGYLIFGITDENHEVVGTTFASRLIKEALNENYIKEEDAENKSRKFAKYIPFWA